jgi:multicomponent Na+:H+ antiporter subunit D
MNALPLFVAVPLGSAFLIQVLVRLYKNMPDWIANLVTVTLFGLSLSMIRFAGRTLVYYVGGWKPVGGIQIGILMVSDGLTVLMLLLVNTVAFFLSLYSISYIKHYTDKTKFYTLFLLALTGLNGIVITGDFFNVFVFLEIASISCYALVAFGVESEELEASFKYQTLGGVASAFILLGLAVFYYITGTLNMADGSQMLAARGANPAVIFCGILFLVGFALKAALIPFHAWLPDAHPAAPAPISALLSGVVIKVLGVYLIIRVFFCIFGTTTLPYFSTVLLVLGILSMVIGAFLALGQKDYNRLLAYSSISQIGYIVVAFGLGTPLAYLGGLFHLLNHAFFKSLLFLNSGAVVYRTDTRDMEKLGGLGQRMPVTSATSLIGSLSISGVPPLGGFWSKLIIIVAAIQARQYAVAMTAVVVSVVTLGYYLKMQKLVYNGNLRDAFRNLKEAPFSMCVSMIALAVLTIGLGVLLVPPLKQAILDPAVRVMTSGLEYAKTIMGG